MTRGLMIAAPRSGSGKTTVTLGLLRAFKRRGVGVVGLKSGPDYIIRPSTPRRRGARASTSIPGR
jgi:cobyrinic acid a,c-diamide synthase